MTHQHRGSNWGGMLPRTVDDAFRGASYGQAVTHYPRTSSARGWYIVAGIVAVLMLAAWCA